MTRKRTIFGAAVAGLALFLLAGAVMASDFENEENGICKVQGTWIRTLEGGPWGPRLIIQETLTPHNPAGDTLTFVERYVNPDETLLGFFPDADYMSASVGEAVRTGLNTYDFSGISYGTRASALPGQREEIEYLIVTSGSIECIDDDTNTTSVILSIFKGDQDADGDGFPDEGAEPFLCFGPFPPETAKRVHPMPQCVPPPPP